MAKDEREQDWGNAEDGPVQTVYCKTALEEVRTIFKKKPKPATNLSPKNPQTIERAVMFLQRVFTLLRTPAPPDDSITLTQEEVAQLNTDTYRFFEGLYKTPAPTFAMPSHSHMFTLIAMFAGKPERIPRKLLTKPQRERTEAEQKEANKFLHSIIKFNSNIRYEADGSENSEETKTYLLSDNPRVKANAEAEYGTMFSSDPAYNEEAQALYIKRTFGAEGMRHLLGLIIGLDENGRQGDFEWEINEHLEKLGYKRKQNGSFAPEAKKTATAIIKVFTSLILTTHRKDGKKEKVEGQKLFSVDGFKIETHNQEIINETLTLHATSFWYRNAFEPKDGKSPQYTKLLKKIAHENHREHPLTIYLAPLLAIFWRMQLEQKLSLKNLMDWCNLDYSNTGRFKKHVRDLEAELNYMVEHGYMGAWENDGENHLPSKCSKPLDCVLSLSPPAWLEGDIQLIHSKREEFLRQLSSQNSSDTQPLTKEELSTILANSELSYAQFGNHIGTSKQAINNYLKGKRRISLDLSDKIREKFPALTRKA